LLCEKNRKDDQNDDAPNVNNDLHGSDEFNL